MKHVTFIITLTMPVLLATLIAWGMPADKALFILRANDPVFVPDPHDAADNSAPYPFQVSASGAGALTADAPPPAVGMRAPTTGAPSSKKSSEKQATHIEVKNATAFPGEQVVVSIFLFAQGNENALGFSLGFNVAELSYVSASLGEAAAGATFIKNSAGAGSGKVGFAISFDPFADPPETFTPGLNEIVKVTFSAMGAAGTVAPVAVTNSPILISASDPVANDLEVTTEDGAVTILGPVACPEAGVLYGQGMGNPDGRVLSYLLSDDALWGMSELPYLPVDTFTVSSPRRLCDVHWWGVEVDADGFDCTLNPNQFAILIAGGSLDTPQEFIVTPEKQVVASGVPFGNILEEGAALLTIYQYNVDLDACLNVCPGEYFINIRCMPGPQPEKDFMCRFGWINSPEGDSVLYQVAPDGGPEVMPDVTGDLAFCMTEKSCSTDEDCDDCDACTEDTCDPVSGGCIFTPVVCDDGIDCTEDSCDPAMGCIHNWVCEGEVEGESSVPHPGDTNTDYRMVLSEAIAYLAGWQQGNNPIAYAIRAAYLWQNGENYRYDGTASPPLCWTLLP